MTMTGHARAAWYCPSCCCDLFGCRGKCIAAAVIHMLLQLLVLCLGCAALRCAVLCCAVLCCAVLCCAVLCCAVLCCAVLCCAALCPCTAWPTHQCSDHSLNHVAEHSVLSIWLEVWARALQDLCVKMCWHGSFSWRSCEAASKCPSPGQVP